MNPTSGARQPAPGSSVEGACASFTTSGDDAELDEGLPAADDAKASNAAPITTPPAITIPCHERRNERSELARIVILSRATEGTALGQMSGQASISLDYRDGVNGLGSDSICARGEGSCWSLHGCGRTDAIGPCGHSAFSCWVGARPSRLPAGSEVVEPCTPGLFLVLQGKEVKGCRLGRLTDGDRSASPGVEDGSQAMGACLCHLTAAASRFTASRLQLP